MQSRKLRCFALGLAALFVFRPGGIAAQVTPDGPTNGRPVAVINLATPAGVQLVKGQWRYSDTKIIEVDHHSVGADLRPSGPPNRTHDITPHAGAADFDDSQWEVLAPAQLEARKSTGRLCFNWYRITVTIPEQVGGFDPTGSTVVFELVIDDYAEIWVNGQLPAVLGQTGGQFVKGFNAPNRVVLGRNVTPGQQFQLAIFGMNAPVSSPPGNFIWIRSATLDFYSAEHAYTPPTFGPDIITNDPALDAIVPADAKLEKIATGFLFTEGPVWVPASDTSPGYLLFSDPNANTIYRWSPDGQVTVYKTKSGYTGVDIGEYNQPGSNGLTLDREGRLTINEHGNRRVTRLEKTGFLTVLADKFEGKRLNSPNDLVYRSDGTLYFTDPPFGLPNFYDDPRKELPYSGVFCWRDGKLQVVSTDLKGPNGIAFSPDEKYLYVGNWDPEKKIVMRYDVKADGTLANGQVFFDMTSAPGDDAIDGIKVDQRGNLYVSGPGGLWIIAPDGKHLGTLAGPEHPHNMAWGEDDGRTLYLTAQTSVYRIRLKIPGMRPGMTKQ
jgi:gluconolactonase